MTQQLKMLVGVALFATLALAGALGIFTLGSAQAQVPPKATRSFSPMTVLPGGTVTVTIALKNLEVTDGFAFANVKEKIPSGFSFTDANKTVDSDGYAGFTRLPSTTSETITYEVTASMTVGDHEFMGTMSTDDPLTDAVNTYPVDGAKIVTVAADGTGTTDPTIEVEPTATTKTTPGSNQSLTLEADVDFTSTDSITVNLKDFGVPSSIAPAQISINVDGDNPETTEGTGANPSDVEVDGTKVTLIGPYETGGSSPVNLAAQGTSNITKIVFRRAAGITLPIRDGDYDIKVSTSSTPEDGDDGDGRENWVTVRRELTVSPTSGTRGTEVTISGKGFTDGTADIMIDGDYTITADVDDGAFTTTVDSAVTDNAGKNVFDGATTGEGEDEDRTTSITISDAATEDAPAKTFEIKPSFTFDPENPTPGQDVTINLVDISGEPTSVTFTGADPIMDIADSDPDDGKDDSVDNIRDADGDAETTTGWKVQVPGDTRIGNVRVTIAHDDVDDPLTKTITIGTNDLTVSPETVVPNQTISIDGGGFTLRGSVNLADVIIDGKPVSDTRDEDPELVNNNGDISFDVTVPQDVSAGSGKRVTVTDSGDRVGTATVTIATAEITISPAESLRGETITVSGTGFPANDLVLIKYNDATKETATTSPTGTFEKEVTVPADEDINPGGTYTIEAVSQVNTPDVSDKEDHKIKGPVITLSPDTATPGSSITISGENFKGFLRVSLIEIGGQDVTPVPAPSTDQWGAFTTSDIQVPQLNLTRHAVKVVVGDDDGSDGDATEFLTLVGTVASNAPADVFASLGDRLVRVWYLDRATQTWSFYDPDPDVAAFNTLTEVSSGQNVSIIISSGANIGFQDKTLYPGTNPIALD